MYVSVNKRCRAFVRSHCYQTVGE